MQEFETRLLLPGTAGIPSHIRVSDDLRVFREFRDPGVTAVAYVPKWSPGATEAFNQQGVARFKAQNEYSKHLEHIAGFEETLPPLKSLLKAGNIELLHHEIFHRPDNAAILDELTEVQAKFIEAVAHALHVPTVHARYHVRDFTSDITSAHVLQPRNPEVSCAHTDAHATGLFSTPVGTVLVDQDGLDIPSVRVDFAHVHEIPLKHLANRLWQTADASFALWRGEREGNPQYHFIPGVVHDVRRARLFALT